jgi:KDO2-lipid IV(A) lauroyltransferase
MALTTTLPAQMALKFNLDIVPIYLARKMNDNFEMEIYDPIKIVNKENAETTKLDFSIKLNKIIEQMISKDPGQWIWTHNRWK